MWKSDNKSMSVLVICALFESMRACVHPLHFKIHAHARTCEAERNTERERGVWVRVKTRPYKGKKHHFWKCRISTIIKIKFQKKGISVSNAWGKYWKNSRFDSRKRWEGGGKNNDVNLISSVCCLFINHFKIIDFTISVVMWRKSSKILKSMTG